MHILAEVSVVYVACNLICAVLLQVHALRQPHNALRFLDVLVAFVLLSLVAVPVLLFTSLEALFGGAPKRSYGPISPAH